MTITIICLVIVVFMPILAKAPLTVAMQKAGGYDNKAPRQQQKNLQGFGARAQAAQDNCFEATTYFAPALLAVMATNAITSTTTTLCITFVILRLIYLMCYWSDLDKLRSVIWLGSIGVVGGLFFQII